MRLFRPLLCSLSSRQLQQQIQENAKFGRSWNVLNILYDNMRIADAIHISTALHRIAKNEAGRKKKGVRTPRAPDGKAKERIDCERHRNDVFEDVEGKLSVIIEKFSRLLGDQSFPVPAQCVSNVLYSFALVEVKPPLSLLVDIANFVKGIGKDQGSQKKVEGDTAGRRGGFSLDRRVSGKAASPQTLSNSLWALASLQNSGGRIDFDTKAVEIFVELAAEVDLRMRIATLSKGKGGVLSGLGKTDSSFESGREEEAERVLSTSNGRCSSKDDKQLRGDMADLCEFCPRSFAISCWSVAHVFSCYESGDGGGMEPFKTSFFTAAALFLESHPSLVREMIGKDVANVLWAFAASGESHKDSSLKTFSLLAKRASDLCDSRKAAGAPQLNPHDIGNILWAVGIKCKARKTLEQGIEGLTENANARGDVRLPALLRAPEEEGAVKALSSTLGEMAEAGTLGQAADLGFLLTSILPLLESSLRAHLFPILPSLLEEGRGKVGEGGKGIEDKMCGRSAVSLFSGLASVEARLQELEEGGGRALFRSPPSLVENQLGQLGTFILSRSASDVPLKDGVIFLDNLCAYLESKGKSHFFSVFCLKEIDNFSRNLLSASRNNPRKGVFEDEIRIFTSLLKLGLLEKSASFERCFSELFGRVFVSISDEENEFLPLESWVERLKRLSKYLYVDASVGWERAEGEEGVLKVGQEVMDRILKGIKDRSVGLPEGRCEELMRSVSGVLWAMVKRGEYSSEIVEASTELFLEVLESTRHKNQVLGKQGVEEFMRESPGLCRDLGDVLWSLTMTDRFDLLETITCRVFLWKDYRQERHNMADHLISLSSRFEAALMMRHCSPQGRKSSCKISVKSGLESERVDQGGALRNLSWGCNLAAASILLERKPYPKLSKDPCPPPPPPPRRKSIEDLLKTKSNSFFGAPSSVAHFQIKSFLGEKNLSVRSEVEVAGMVVDMFLRKEEVFEKLLGTSEDGNIELEGFMRGFVLEVQGPWHFLKDCGKKQTFRYRETGPSRLKRLCLERMGFVVVPIIEKEFLKCRREERGAFFSSEIKARLDSWREMKRNSSV